MTSTEKNISVLTGDLVASTSLSNQKLEEAFRALGEAATQIKTWLGNDILFTRHRGDGWQVVVRPAKYDLRVALCLITNLKALGPGFDTRIALARGPGTTPNKDLNRAHGLAFNESGSTLDHLSDLSSPVRILHASRGSLRAIGLLLDAISQNWTSAQARAIVPMLVPDQTDKTGPIATPTHAEVAKRLGISRQAVSKALSASKFEAIHDALFQLELETNS